MHEYLSKCKNSTDFSTFHTCLCCSSHFSSSSQSYFHLDFDFSARFDFCCLSCFICLPILQMPVLCSWVFLALYPPLTLDFGLGLGIRTYSLGGTGSEEPACRCRGPKRYGFNLWVGKIPRRRRWQPTPVFLPGETHGWRSLAGYSPWGRKQSDTLSDLAQHLHSAGRKAVAWILLLGAGAFPPQLLGAEHSLQHALLQEPGDDPLSLDVTEHLALGKPAELVTPAVEEGEREELGRHGSLLWEQRQRKGLPVTWKSRMGDQPTQKTSAQSCSSSAVGAIVLITRAPCRGLPALQGNSGHHSDWRSKGRPRGGLPDPFLGEDNTRPQVRF